MPMRMARPSSLAQLHQRSELLLDARQFRGVLLVGVFLDGELLGVGVVAGVDADHFDPPGGFHGGVGLEMDVGHDRDVAAARAQFGHDVLQVGGVLYRRRGDADDLAAHRDQLQVCLTHSAVSIVSQVIMDCITTGWSPPMIDSAPGGIAHDHLAGAAAAEKEG